MTVKTFLKLADEQKFEITPAIAKAAVSNLKQSKKLLAKPERWTQGVLETEDGAYCLMGAVGKIDGLGEELATGVMIAVSPYFEKPDEMFNDASYNKEPDAVTEFNDDEKTTHKKILKFLDKSIAFAEKLLVAVKGKKK